MLVSFQNCTHIPILLNCSESSQPSGPDKAGFGVGQNRHSKERTILRPRNLAGLLFCMQRRPSNGGTKRDDDDS